MKFGKNLRNEVAQKLPEWEGEFISYKDLKKQLNLIAPWNDKETKRPRKRPRMAIDNCVMMEEQNTNLTGEETGFIQLLRDELEKINSFFDDKEEEYVIRLKELRDEVAILEGSGGNATQVIRDLLDFYREMVLLLRYGVLNLEGLRKIVKKHKKKTGSFVLSPFMLRVLQQPFFSTDLLHKLLRECEATLRQLLLPI
ncbi:hypothetical protein RJ639_007094 [Escallonia herrerae]|uniref:SPX domain-containing protein n=1 Tax=Escallonia herrerae TaxID=1293975 RepID=A0AA88VYS7_9ASTE|nr:hypothetical protein RJ639_007094 [Escallonia herrerae]